MPAGDRPHRDVVLLVRRGRDRVGRRRVGKDLVLGRERRGRVLEDHHPRVEATRGGEERWQAPVEARIDEERDPPLGDRAQFGDRELREIERERDRLAVEVAAADHEPAARRGDVCARGAALGKDERVVRGGVQLDVENPAQVVERVADGAVDLGHAAQRVRVLHLVARAVVGGHEARIAQEMTKLGGDRDLARMRSGELVRRGERDVGSEQRLDRLRRGDRRGPGQAIRVGEQERPERAHQLRPVEERQALLRLEREWLDPGLTERNQRRLHLAAHLHLAAPDERQREVRERREVAGRPDASLRRDDRVDPRLEEREESLDQDRPAAGVAERERVRPEQQHRPDHVPGQRRADAHRVADEEVLLELPGVGRRDVGRG